MVEPHVAPQLHQCAIRLFPRPVAGALRRLCQSIPVFFHPDDDGLAIVRLRLLLHDGKNALGAGSSRKQCIDLLADLPHGLADLLDVQQVRAQRAHIEHAADGQQAADAAGDGVVDLAEVAHGGHHHTGVGLGRSGRVPVAAVEPGEACDGLVLVVKDLDDLLSLDHLLDIAVHGAQRRLLPLEIGAAAAADRLDDHGHQAKEQEGDQCQPWIQHDHHHHRAHKGQHIGDDAGEAAVQHFRNGVDIVGEPAHQVAGLVPVIVADGQLLQPVEQILPQRGHRVLRHMDHDTGIGIGAQGAEGEQPAHQQQHLKKSRKIAGDDIAVQQRLEHIAGGHAGAGADHKAYRHQHQRALVPAYIAHQLPERALYVLGPLETMAAGAVTVPAPGSVRLSRVSHRCSPLPAGIHRPRGRSRSSPSAACGCPAPPHDRRPAPGSYPHPLRR